jgi:hypothetical protein
LRGYEPEGREFESLRARHLTTQSVKRLLLLQHSARLVA